LIVLAMHGLFSPTRKYPEEAAAGMQKTIYRCWTHAQGSNRRSERARAAWLPRRWPGKLWSSELPEDAMSKLKGNAISNLRQLLEQRRVDLKRLERDRKKLSKKLDTIFESIKKLSSANVVKTKRVSLLDAAGAGEIRLVRAQLAAGADPNERNEDGESPLLLAIYGNAPLGAIRVLIGAGADVNAVDNDGNTPLMIAATDAQLAIVKELVEHKANVNARNKEGDTPLTNAACWGSGKVVRLLIKSGANRRLPDGKGITAAELARQQGHRTIAAQLTSND